MHGCSTKCECYKPYRKVKKILSATFYKSKFVLDIKYYNGIHFAILHWRRTGVNLRNSSKLVLRYTKYPILSIIAGWGSLIMVLFEHRHLELFNGFRLMSYVFGLRTQKTHRKRPVLYSRSHINPQSGDTDFSQKS